MVKKDSKFKVEKTVSTVEGTLYENETVKLMSRENSHYRVKDAMGKIWFVHKNKLTLLE